MSKKTPRKVPKNVGGMSREKLAEVLKVKRECNAKALNVVKFMIEGKVDEEIFLEQLQYINQSHFDDIVDERSISKICGYPLCGNKLEDLPTKTYHISVNQNKVYDISNRKKFCCEICFSSAVFIKDQMLTSPLWLRDVMKAPKFKLLTAGDEVLKGEEINFKIMMEKDMILSKKEAAAEETRAEVKTSNVKDQASGYTQKVNVQAKNNMAKDVIERVPVMNNYKLCEMPDTRQNLQKPLTLEDIIQHMESCVLEWFTIQTLVFLLGEEKVRSKCSDRIKNIEEIKLNITSSITDEKILNLCKKLNLFCFDDLSSETRHLKPLPDYKMVKEDCDVQKIKARAFYTGALQHEIPVEDHNNDEDGVEEQVEYIMPQVDSHSQNVLRRKILTERLNHIVSDMLSHLNIMYRIEVKEIREVVTYFNLTPSNIVFKPQEWKLLALIVIKLICLKSAELSDELSTVDQSSISSILSSYKLDSSYLDNFIDKVTDVERLLTKLKS